MSKSSTGVIASFNQDKYLRESITSLASEVDEVIVVDDYSSDDSRSILQSDLPNNVKVSLNDRTVGVSETLNRAIQQAQGEYIFLQGGDDVCIPGRVKEQVKLIESTSSIFCFSLPQVIGENGSVMADDVAPEFFIETKPTREEQIHTLLFKANYICAPSVSFKRKTFDDLGGFNPNLLFLQDFDLWLTMLAIGPSVFTENRLVKYRKHGKNLSREGSQDSGFRKFRFDLEYAFSIEHAIDCFSPDLLTQLLELSGKEPSESVELNRLLLLISHEAPSIQRLASEKLLKLQSIPKFRLELQNRGLDESGFKFLAARAFEVQNTKVSN
jgi:glycosyltransferase involved in cell wall biosynthesis